MNTAEDRAKERWEEPSSSPAPSSGNGGGSDVGERLATLEERVRHLATSAEVEQVKTGVAKVETSAEYLKWMVGIIIAGILLILGKLFLTS